MKSYDETITSVFDKIQTQRAKQKRKKQIVLSTVVPVCLMAFSITGIWMYQRRDIHNYTLSDPTAPVSMDSAPAEPTNPADKIIINSLEDIPDQRMNIALHRKDEIIMTLEELSEYYGTDIVPEVPSELTRQNGETYRIYKRDNGTGELYWDQNNQYFSNGDQSKNLVVDTRKGNLPFYCVVVYEPEYEKSVINGTEVLIGLDESGWYQVWFMYQNTGFFIGAEGVTEDELVNVIRSLTD